MSAEPMFLLDELMRLIERYMSVEDIARIHEAYKLAEQAHAGVVRRSGELYITHPLSVARMLADMRVDADTICGGLLHDVVEDNTDYSIHDIEDRLGPVVAQLVDGVTKLDKKNFDNKQDAVIASFRKMMEYFVKDYRVVLIKFADRLHNLRTLEHMSATSRRRIAKETMAVYVPLAQRMGMNVYRREMQLLAFQHMHHWRAKTLQASLDLYLKANKDKHDKIVKTMHDALQKPIPSANVFVWEKNLYRIYERIKHQGKRFDEQREVLEVRVVVGTVDQCYRALGILHSLAQPKPGEFFDFIASPKTYGFQALQTIVVYPKSMQAVRIQIQTRDMYHVSQYGIAALWRYPELTRRNNGQIAKQAVDKWLNQVKELAALAENPSEFHADIQAALFLSEVYVFTPKGEVKEFPAGASLVDFAYAVHTEVGHHCIGARVDGVEKPLRTKIVSGTSVEIITDSEAVPELSWLEFVITARARSAIRNWERSQASADLKRLGERLLRQALHNYGYDLEQIELVHFEALLSHYALENMGALFRAIAHKEYAVNLIAMRLIGETDMAGGHSDAPLLVKGAEGLGMHCAQCCYPLPHEPIEAYLDAECGLIIHRESCAVLRDTVPSKEILRVSWAENAADECYLAAIRTQAHNVVGVLRQITATFAQQQVNIEDIHTSGDQYIKATRWVVWVHDIEHLQAALRQVEHISDVISVERITEAVS